jgi:mono/diheme cytochrome c family protein
MEVKGFAWNSLAGRMLITVFLGLILLIGYYTFGTPSAGSSTKAGQEIFNEECQSCHTIGGGELVGPDLKGVLERRDRDWVERFIASPDWLIAEGDPIALELLDEYYGVEMPNQALTEEDVESIMVFLEVQDSLTQTAVVLPIGSASRGEKLFSGAQGLENGGTPCMACHTVGGVGDYGGGNLGPDLTLVFDRYGEPGLISTMQNISFPTMKNIYAGKALTPQESADLLALFSEANVTGGEGVADSVTGLFWGSGAVGALVLFGFMAIFWPRQNQNQTERLRKKADAASRRIHD